MKRVPGRSRPQRGEIESKEGLKRRSRREKEKENHLWGNEDYVWWARGIKGAYGGLVKEGLFRMEGGFGKDIGGACESCINSD